MSVPKTVGILFETPPNQWGLRGDPYLWDELRIHFSSVPLPASLAELKALIENVFIELSGKSVACPDNFFVDRYAHGGMSSGHICPEFWRKKAIPLLLARFSGQNNLACLNTDNKRPRRK